MSAFCVSTSRRLGCLILSRLASRPSSEPYSVSSWAAFLGPMPGTPGTLSLVSPISASASQTSSGPTPNFSITSARPMAFCFIGSHIATWSATSCIRSLSEETMVTGSPAARAALA